MSITEDARFDEIYLKLSDARTIIVFGYAKLGKDLYEILIEKFPQKTICVCDNALKSMKTCNGEDIFSLDEAAVKYPESIFVLTSLRHRDNMISQLRKYAVSENRILIPYAFISYEIGEEKKKTIKKKSSTELTFLVDVVKHCNLNCAGCEHFSPLSDEEYMSIGDFKRDIQRMSQLFEGDVGEINLLGGEPLLHPDINVFLTIARDYFPKTVLKIITNAILLDRMPKKFWEACRTTHTEILLSCYPIHINYDELKSLAKKEGVVCHSNKSTAETGNTFDFFTLDLRGRQNPEKSFQNCTRANACITMDHGRIYPCSRISNIKAFSKYFSWKPT